MGGPPVALVYPTMPIAAVLLFGSQARGDQARGSDTDILLVSEGAHPRHVSAGHLSMFFYPWTKLQADAQSGDLFVCHIVREAIALYDPESRLPKLRDMFTLRVSYSHEIAKATDLGWFLVRYGADINSALVAKRMIWCVRTILIARAAETGSPIFAPHALSKFARSERSRELLAERHNRKANATMRHRFQRFLVDEAPPEIFHAHAARDEFVERFRITFNEVALQTLEQENRSRATYR